MRVIEIHEVKTSRVMKTRGRTELMNKMSTSFERHKALVMKKIVSLVHWLILATVNLSIFKLG